VARASRRKSATSGRRPHQARGLQALRAEAIMKTTIRLLFVSALVAFGGGCREELDCFDICVNFQQCISVDIDITECSSRCEDYAERSDANASQADACEDCLDGRSCNDCSAVCSFVVTPRD
jgi:hypothetical protein